jgi:hypothetical protein
MESERDRSIPPDTTTEGAAQQPLLEYVCYPAGRNRTVTILTTVFLVICVILVWLISKSIFMTVLSVMILFGSLAGFYTRTRYRLYDSYLTVKTPLSTLKKEWAQYRSFYPDKNGVLLSPFTRPTRMENFRGLYVKFAGNKEQVMGIVRSRISFEADES